MHCILQVPNSSPLLPIVLLCAGMLAGCVGSQSTTRTTVQTNKTWSPEDVESRLESAASEWAGTPHKWGGSSSAGVDCSGLVQSVYDTQFQVSVPRTTEQQARTGRAVSRSTLQPGDLVFFRIASTAKKRHVGIYISNDEFLHASSSEGVTISSLDQSYWSDRWWQARRVLHASHRASSASVDSTNGESRSANVGW